MLPLLAKGVISCASQHYYRPKRSFGQGYIFAGVCHSVNRGGAVPDQAHPPWQVHPPAGTPPSRKVHPPPGRYTPLPGRYTPLKAGTPPRYTPPPGRYTPPETADPGIRSTIGQYTSYWNAFLFEVIDHRHHHCIPIILLKSHD